MSNDLTLLVGRVLLVLMFLLSGISIISAPGGFAGFMGSIGLPAPMLVTWLIIALKILGGIAIIIGFQTRWAAYAFALFCVATAFMGHSGAGDEAVFWKNIAVAGGLLILSVSGPGALSVDARRG